MTEQTAVGLRSERGPVLMALMLCTGLVAIEATILATAVPSIVADIGGFAQFPWLFSIYLLAQAVSVHLVRALALRRRPGLSETVLSVATAAVIAGVAWTYPLAGSGAGAG